MSRPTAWHWTEHRESFGSIGERTEGLLRNRKSIRKPSVSNNLDTRKLLETEPLTNEQAQDGLNPPSYM